jgi:hypothetical protein
MIMNIYGDLYQEEPLSSQVQRHKIGPAVRDELASEPTFWLKSAIARRASIRQERPPFSKYKFGNARQFRFANFILHYNDVYSHQLDVDFRKCTTIPE